MKTYIFELLGAPKSVYADVHGKPTNMSTRNFSIPAEVTTLIKNEDGSYSREQIRYARTFESVFLKDQELGNRRVTSVVSKPQFSNGILVVKESQTNLLNFLRMHPMNEANQHWGLEGQRSIFREKDFAKMARIQNENNKKVIKATRLVYEADYTTQIVPVARYLGIDVNRDSDMVQYDVDQYARNNPEDFVELLDNPVVQRHSEVMRAADLGLLKVEPHRVSWGDGRTILEVPASHNASEYFAEMTFEDKYRGTWYELERKMGKVGTPADQDLTDSKSEAQEELDALTTEELIDVLKAKGVIEWKVPRFTVYLPDGKTEKFKTKDELSEYVEENRKILTAILLK